MKVALVLTGLLRCYEKAYPSLKSYVLDRFDTDVYLDIWDEVGYYSGKGYTQAPTAYFISTTDTDRGFHDSGEKIDVNALMDVYRPISLTVHKFAAFESDFDTRAKQFQNAFTRPKNTCAQAFKIYSGVRNIAKPYDVVIRARPDIMLETDIGTGWVEKARSGEGVFTLPSRNKMGTGTGDSFMIASLQRTDEFADLHYNSLETIYNRLGVSCPHLFVQETLRMMDVTHYEISANAQVAHSPRGLYQEPV
jgi:hypothetical protein